MHDFSYHLESVTIQLWTFWDPFRQWSSLGSHLQLSLLSTKEYWDQVYDAHGFSGYHDEHSLTCHKGPHATRYGHFLKSVVNLSEQGTYGSLNFAYWTSLWDLVGILTSHIQERFRCCRHYWVYWRSMERRCLSHLVDGSRSVTIPH